MDKEYIEREAALENIACLGRQNFLSDDFQQYLEGVKDADIRVRSIPAADVRPVKHGEWIFDCERTMADWTYRQYHCSSCNGQTIGGIQNFCMFCGADMREES